MPSPSPNVFTHEHRMCTRIGKFKLRFYKDSVHVFRIVQRVNSTFKCVGIVREEVKEFLIFRKKSFMTRPGFVGLIIDSSSIRTRTTYFFLKLMDKTRCWKGSEESPKSISICRTFLRLFTTTGFLPIHVDLSLVFFFDFPH